MTTKNIFKSDNTIYMCSSGLWVGLHVTLHNGIYRKSYDYKMDELPWSFVAKDKMLDIGRCILSVSGNIQIWVNCNAYVANYTIFLPGQSDLKLMEVIVSEFDENTTMTRIQEAYKRYVLWKQSNSDLSAYATCSSL